MGNYILIHYSTSNSGRDSLFCRRCTSHHIYRLGWEAKEVKNTEDREKSTSANKADT